MLLEAPACNSSRTCEIVFGVLCCAEGRTAQLVMGRHSPTNTTEGWTAQVVLLLLLVLLSSLSTDGRRPSELHAKLL